MTKKDLEELLATSKKENGQLCDDQRQGSCNV